MFEFTDFKGKSSVCNLPVCCEYDSPDPKTEDEAAGEWGTLGNCDLPFKTVQLFSDFSHNEIKPDFFVWLGTVIVIKRF